MASCIDKKTGSRPEQSTKASRTATTTTATTATVTKASAKATQSQSISTSPVGRQTASSPLLDQVYSEIDSLDSLLSELDEIDDELEIPEP